MKPIVIHIPKVEVPRSGAAVVMRARRQSAGPHKDRRQGRGNPRTAARRTWREEQ